MAQLNFPEALSDGQVYNGSNGVIYTYVGNPPNGYWSGTFQNDALDTLDNRYVEKAGDTMTGDIQIGGDPGIGGANGIKARNNGFLILSRDENKAIFAGYNTGNNDATSIITAEGNAEFAGIVENSRSYNFRQLTDAEVPGVSDSTECALFGYTSPTGGNVVRANIAANGSAEFAGSVQIGGDPDAGEANGIKGLSNGLLILSRNGNNTVFAGHSTGNDDATSIITAGGDAGFAGRVQIGGEAPTSEGSVYYSTAVDIRRDDGGGVYSVFRNGDRIANRTIAFSSAGAAEFAGQIDINGVGGFAGYGWAIANNGSLGNKTPSGTTFSLTNTGSATFATFNPTSGSTRGVKLGIENDYATVFVQGKTGTDSNKALEVWLANAERWSVTFNGTSTFSNTILNLEPDNDANYTTTTENYTEEETYTGPLGNTLTRDVTKTRDIRTYTGPTLDVKDKLQNLISRIDSIEANEIADDATDNALLQLVASLTQRLDEKDAAIASLTASLSALTSRVTTLET